jgi:predicted transcriptional regulator
MTQDEQRSAALSFRIKPSLKRELEELAKADRRPLSNFLEIALEALVESKKQPAGKKR